MVTEVVVTEVGYTKFDNFFPSRGFIMLLPRQARWQLHCYCIPMFVWDSYWYYKALFISIPGRSANHGTFFPGTELITERENVYNKHFSQSTPSLDEDLQMGCSRSKCCGISNNKKRETLNRTGLFIVKYR